MPHGLSPFSVPPEPSRLSTEEAKDILRGLRKASEAYPDGAVSQLARTLADWFARYEILTHSQSVAIWYGADDKYSIRADKHGGPNGFR